MPFPRLATPEAGAYLTEMASVSANGASESAPAPNDVTSYVRNHGGSPVWLIPTRRSPATEAFVPLDRVPRNAEILAVGRHGVFNIFAVAWLSPDNEIIVTVTGTHWELGRTILVHLYSKAGIKSGSAVFEAEGGCAIATVVIFGEHDGSPVAGLTLIHGVEAGEEC